MASERFERRARPRIIGSVHYYVGTRHRWATGQPVRIVAVIRGSEESGGVLLTDEEIGELSASDTVEFAPLVEEPGEPPRWS